MTGKVEYSFDGTKSLFSDQEMSYMVSQTAGLIRGPLNYYRTHKLRFEEEQAAPDLPFVYKMGLPVLHLRGLDDATSPEVPFEIARKVLPWGRFITYEGAGHWLMLERKDEVIRDVLDWLADMKLKSKL